jgi:quercetin dioxygenase-like cupin family protein
MEIKRNGSRPSSYGGEDNFTGRVRRDPIHISELPSRLSSGHVTFEPGARTRWHQHPVGQLLIITAGHGRVGSWGGPVQEVSAGDVVWIEAGEKHWHGAGPDTAMSHIAVTESEHGVAVEWLEPVADDQFRGEQVRTP